jgi:hypothetical protein
MISSLILRSAASPMSAREVTPSATPGK